MRWPWRRRGDQAAVEQARAELEEAQARLAETQKTGDQVARVAEQLRKLRERNHFAAMISKAMRGNR